MSKQILLINDMAGYGKVALSAMIPVLSHMRHHIYNLPTALVSNTLDYGKFDILETTDYMEHTMKIWDELGFSFDAVSTGFIVSERQAKLVAEFCRQQSRKGTRIFVDPIMGDEGKLYNGVTEQTISHMKELVKVADYIVPNYTEAACLAGEQYKEDGMTLEEADCLIEKESENGERPFDVAGRVPRIRHVLDYGRRGAHLHDCRAVRQSGLPQELRTCRVGRPSVHGHGLPDVSLHGGRELPVLRGEEP